MFRRWWVLFLLSLCSLQQGNNFASYSVVYDATHKTYGWNKQSIDILTSWAQIMFIPIALILPYLSQLLSVRVFITISSLLIFISSSLRIITIESPYALVLAHISQILNGISGPFVISTSTLLSSEWFPVNQRTLSTSISISSSYSGTAICYATTFIIDEYVSLLNVLRIEAIIGFISFIIILIDQYFFDNLPKIPPSISQKEQKNKKKQKEFDIFQFKKEIITILQNIKFEYFALTIGLYQGVIVGWTGVLDTILGPNFLGFKQNIVGVIGISILFTIMFSTIIFGFINDFLKQMFLKKFLIILLSLSGIFLILFTFIANGIYLKLSTNLSIIFVVIGIFCNAGTYGLSYEAAVENSYPCREIISCALLTTYINIFAALFTLINTYISPYIMNWIVSLTQIGCAVLLCFYQQSFNRFKLDNESQINTLIQTDVD